MIIRNEPVTCMLGAPAFPTFTDAYTAVLGHVTQHPEHVISARGNHADECLNVSFILTDPRERIVWSPARRPNIVFSYAEVLWHLLGRDDLTMIGYYAPGMRRYSADGTRLPGTAYGRKLFGMHGEDERGQWDRVRSLVTSDPSTKRAVLAIFDPAELADPGSPDVSCALALHLLLRDGRLHAVTYMRANDAMIGLPCDVFAFSMIQEFLARQLGASLGTYTHHVASMHVNHPDARRAKRIVTRQDENVRFPAATVPFTTWDDIRAIGQLEEALRRNEHHLDPAGLSATRLAPYWQQVVLLFEAYRQISHDGGTVSTATMDALDPGHRHLVAWRWPEAVPAGFPEVIRGPAMSHLAILDATDWSAWSVVLLKPDCLERGLVEGILDRIAPHVAIMARQVVTVTEAQIFAHYDDLLQHPEWVAPVDPVTDLRRRYVGQQVITALARGPAAGPGSPGTPALLRGLLGHFDPAQAGPGSIRGHFGTDSLATARAEGRLIDNLIHTSDHPAAARRDFLIWFGPGRATLLASCRLTGATS